MNKKFLLIIVAFTLTVPGFFIFSYWHLGVFSSVEVAPLTGSYSAVLYGGRHQGDYNKTGGEVVKTKRLLINLGAECEPVLVYFENAMNTAKPNLRSAGGCIIATNAAPNLVAALKKEGREAITLDIKKGYRLTTYAQTAIALRKVWTELARLVDKGTVLRFPLVQLVRPNGDSEFLIGID